MTPCKICHQKNHSKTECWMRYVVLNKRHQEEENCDTLIQIDLCNVIKSPQNKDKGNCPVCFEKIKDTNCGTTACGHNFCLSCIVKAGRNNNDCPLCRQSISDTDIVARRLLFDDLPPLSINRIDPDPGQRSRLALAVVDLPPLSINRIDPDPELREHLPPLLPRGAVLARRLAQRLFRSTPEIL